MSAEAVTRWPSHLDTAEFRRWFGQSKVVDADGIPAVAYHGTTPWQRADGRQLGDIESFDRMASVRIVGRRQSVDTIGSWFSTNPGPHGAAMYSGLGGAIYPVYLAISNPYCTTFATMVRRGHLLAGTNPDTISPSPGVFETAAYRFGQPQVDALRAWLKATGRDGIRLRHDTSKGQRDEFFGQECWIALEPEQVKSSLANRGTYDPHDARITFKRAAAPAVTPDEADEEEHACAPKF